MSDQATNTIPSQALEQLSYSESQPRYWDWSGYADSEGYLDVILIDEEKGRTADSSDSMRSILSRYLGTLESKTPGKSEENAVKREYSFVFNGLSAHLDLKMVQEIQSENQFIRIYPDIEITTMASENIIQVGADQVWAMKDSNNDFVKGSGVIVAIVDTGVDYTHPDLGGGFGPGHKVIGGYDFVNNDNDPIDDHGHGTHVAGIVAASGGISGVAPEASILAYKVLDQGGRGTMSDVIEGIEAAMDPNSDGDMSDHADVISLSLGGAGEQNDPLCSAVSSAVDAGIVVVVAAGNDGPRMGTVASPGLEPKAITVGAIDGENALASFSSRGTGSESSIKPEISAPGVDIKSTVPYSDATYSSPTGYLSMSGTSMATPHVSGVAALLLQLHPDWTPAQVKSAIITGSSLTSEPLWHAGAGALWAPSAAETDMFLSETTLASFILGGMARSITVTNEGPAGSFVLDTIDWHTVWYNGTCSEPYWTNVSTVTPSGLTISSGESGVVQIAVATPVAPSPEGYYDGALYLTDSGRSMRVPFGFVVLSHLNVHVLSRTDREVSDPRGVVLAYSYPDAAVSLVASSTPLVACPPASFLLPSGCYSVHALGHQLFYLFTDPYILSDRIDVGRVQTVDLYLSMAEAREFNLNVTTGDCNAIYVKDFQMYCRYSGDVNVSVQSVASDSLIIGTDMFSLPKSRSVYISETDATVGISVVGFSYSADMWDFMSRNCDHWYEYSGSTSTDFLIESTANLQYLMSWEFHGIDSSSQQELGLDESRCSVFETKYDIPGSIEDRWAPGSLLTIGGEATHYVRMDSYTSLNPFFSGITRTVFVQGVYFEKYWPGSLSDLYVSPQYYTPDYGHTVKARDVSDVYMPDRQFLGAIEGISEPVRIGSGPFYPSVRMMNNASTVVLVHPLLRDQGGARVASPETPWLYLFRNGGQSGSWALEEHRGNPAPVRVIPLAGGGDYEATVPLWYIASQVSSTAIITLGFSTDSSDMNPPTVTGLTMPQRFVPGESIYVELTADDDVSIGGASISWRSSGTVAWQSLMTEELDSGRFGAAIETADTDVGVDLKLKVYDTTGNYLEYTTTNASLKQVPIVYDLSVDSQDVPYFDGDTAVVVSGHLARLDGHPLCSAGAIPIDLMLDGRKVAMILDERVESGSHYHDGTIRFEWHFNPARLFAGPNETIEIHADVDLGIYQPVASTLYLHSVKVGNSAPTIHLLSPSDGSTIPAGQVIDLSIWDDGAFDADAELDGSFLCHLSSPWDVDTSTWSDGEHVLAIVVIDDEGLVSTGSFDFDVDALAPSVTILYPGDGAHVPQNSTLRAEVSDSRLSSVWYSADGRPAISFYAPYEIDMTGWIPGVHTVDVRANDVVGHLSSDNVSFTIAWGSIVVDVLSPQNQSVINSGVPILVSVIGDGKITTKWAEYGTWHELGVDSMISTAGWSEGLHQVTINATNDLGEFDEYDLVIVIDDTPPRIILDSPANNSFVDISDEISLRVVDANLQATLYTLWNVSASSILAEIAIPLSSSPCDGVFGLFVTSFDKAGNAVRASFSFAMDSSPPVLSMDGFSPGDAIKQGGVINVTVEDPFISDVRWSLDEGSLEMLGFPYDISTDGLSAGWHEFGVVATDYSGKQSVLNISLYVDMTAPAVQVMPVGAADSVDSIDIRAIVSDDYAIENVTLYYELQNGSYGSMAMMLNGTEYVAELTIDVLWDGMIVYVVAEDTVGNFGESPHIAISGEALPDNSRDDSSKGGPISWLWFGTQGGLLTLGFIAAASILTSVFMVGRRRSPTEKGSDEPLSFGSVRENIRANLHSVEPPLSVSPTQIAFVTSAPLQSVKPAHAAAAKPAHEVPKRTLVDAIPEMVFMPGIPTEDPEDDTDYGEMIERELDLSAFKKSVFREEIREEDVDREFEALFGGPQIVSGLLLKRLMDLDMEKM